MSARFFRRTLHDPQCLRAAEGIQANFHATAPYAASELIEQRGEVSLNSHELTLVYACLLKLSFKAFKQMRQTSVSQQPVESFKQL